MGDLNRARQLGGVRVVAWTPDVRIQGSTGTAIDLETSPASSPDRARKNISRARLGSTVLIRGSTEPKLARGTITLSVVRPGRRAPVTLARVRTAHDGRFSRRWNPSKPGVYDIMAASPAGPHRVADYTCPVSIDVKPPPDRNAARS
jgi:hypothetical protein